jgi:OmpA-OmpF porin, OOP family
MMNKMKKILCALILLLPFLQTKAQFVVNKKTEVKRKANDRLNQRSSDAIDRGLDKVEEGIGNLFKKKKKNGNTTNGNASESTATQDNTQSNGSAQAASGQNAGNASSKNTDGSNYKSSSKFDFVAGTKELYFDNFERLNIGDFPAEYNTNASGEVVTLDNKPGKWLKLSKNGAFIPEIIKDLPDNFTLEFEVGIIGKPTNNYTGFGLNFTTQKDELMKDYFFDGHSGTSIVYLHPGAAEASISVLATQSAEVRNTLNMPQWDVDNNRNFVKISLWRQKGRLRVYANEDKVIDVPRFFSENNKYQFAFFRRFFRECELFVTNIRLAVAEADTRNKLLTEGRFVTNGILFNVNSDIIKPESASILKEIATVLQENATINIKIIGHTDSDGEQTANLTLSTKRAEAIKAELSTKYNIAAGRMQTEGKGESEPLNSNSTAAEKAQNRRVEFIKL